MQQQSRQCPRSLCGNTAPAVSFTPSDFNSVTTVLSATTESGDFHLHSLTAEVASRLRCQNSLSCNAPQKEASDVFFAATKLFQAKDPHLRRMVYLCIKDICPGSDEVIIVTSSLMKDMNSKVELYR